jgi:hypothetical protein
MNVVKSIRKRIVAEDVISRSSVVFVHVDFLLVAIIGKYGSHLDSI